MIWIKEGWADVRTRNDMAESGYALFRTALGVCGIVWSAAGLVGVHLPEASEAAAARAMASRFPAYEPADPPLPVREAIARIAAYLDGASDDFADVALDFGTTGAFDRSVYEATRAIPAGRTTTYGAVAAEIGDSGGARAVGQALGRNPWPILVPCHRVTGADGRMGGFSAPGGAVTKRRLLDLEGALAPETLPLFGDH
jgi:methylated-DNA-[protein]-cysteine S-methyltransferase